MLRVSNAQRDSSQFRSAQSYLRTLPQAPTNEQWARNRSTNQPTGTSGRVPDSRPSTGNIARPDTRYQTYNEGNLFRVNVPSNWRELASNDNVTFAPEGAYGTINGNSVFTHGVQIGVSRNENHDLQTATDELLQALRQSNPQLRSSRNYDRGSIGGRQAVYTTATNVSDATGGQERIDVYTTLLSDGSLFYVIGVAPREEFSAYSNAFRTVVRSIQFTR
jgi:hypothetical protein